MRTVLIPPRQHCYVESDAFDRSAFAALVEDAPSLKQVLDAGGALVPHFRELLEDVFCLLYKLEPRWRDPSEVAPAAALNRVLLDALREHPLLAHVHGDTQLDEVASGIATVLIGEHVLGLLRREALLPRGDLLDLWDLERQEDELRRRGEELSELDDSEAGEETRDAAERAAKVAEARLRQKSQNMAQRLREMPARARNALPDATSGLKRQLAEAQSDAHGWGTGLGSGGRSSPGRQIELGRRLATNPKLRKLGAAVGRMRALAMALRKRGVERANEEMYAVAMGSEIERLLPPELLALRHPILRRDFARRLIEGRLLSYELRGLDDRGRGPMIVCLDGSASMAGEKEIWGKAVALTLLEIARRQRRLFRFIGFSSREEPLFTLDLNPREHHRVSVDRALDVAEHFPGGGTDFEMPLDAARDGLAAARWRRGDVVLITDGECRVDPAWAERFRADKKRLGFSLFSVLIDVGASSVETLAELSDKVTSVTRLTDEAVRDLFLAL
jgi:uncharacterized protein with von Willebrand factor type A (vWA) domain